MRRNLLKTLFASVVAAILLLIVPQEAKAAPGDVTVMYMFKSPIDGKIKAWVAIEGPDGTYFPGTITQGGGFQPGWHWITGGDGDGNDGELPIDVPLEEFPNFSDAAYADVVVTQSEESNESIVTTDKPVQVQLVNSQTGDLIGELETVAYSKTIDISGLSVGCKYMLVIKQDIEGFPVVLPAVNICKMP